MKSLEVNVRLLSSYFRKVDLVFLQMRKKESCGIESFPHNHNTIDEI